MTLSLREFILAAWKYALRALLYRARCDTTILNSPLSILNKKEIGKANLFLCYSIASTSSILVRYLS